MKILGPVVVSVVLVVLPGFAPAFATEEVEEAGETPEWAEEGRNHVALFLGAASNEEETAAALGFDYFYRASRVVSVGGFVEFTGGESREGLLGALLVFHVARRVNVYGAPCVEYDRKDGSSGFAFRIGAEYTFPLGKGFEIAPSLNYDMSDQENTWVYGLVLGKNF